MNEKRICKCFLALLIFIPHVLCDEINYKSVKVFATHGTANKFLRCNAKQEQD